MSFTYCRKCGCKWGYGLVSCENTDCLAATYSRLSEGLKMVTIHTCPTFPCTFNVPPPDDLSKLVIKRVEPGDTFLTGDGEWKVWQHSHPIFYGVVAILKEPEYIYPTPEEAMKLADENPKGFACEWQNNSEGDWLPGVCSGRIYLEGTIVYWIDDVEVFAEKILIRKGK